jgi:hypothetical protein
MSAHNPPMLTGNVPDERDEIIAGLRGDVRHLERLLEEEKRRSVNAVGKLRTQLTPLYNALQQLFGDMDAIGGGEAPAAAAGASGKWVAIKSKMPQRHRECIDLLAIAGKMRRGQIAAAMKMDKSNCSKNVIGILLRQGFLVDNNGEIELRQI